MAWRRDKMSEEKDINDPQYLSLEKRVMEIETRVSLMEKIIAKMEGTLEQLDKRVSMIEEDIRRLDMKVDGLRAEVKEDIRRLDEKIDTIGEKVDSNFKWTIAIMVGGFIATIATSIILKILLG
jgi:uncharacterized coiled-coil protein SlyX